MTTPEISPADDEFYQVVSLAAKLGRAGPLLRRLEERYEADWSNVDACVRYALACMVMLDVNRSESSNHGWFDGAMTALGDALSADPDHWLARYCRARLRALVPATFDVYMFAATPERIKGAEDAERLLALQKDRSWQPHHPSAHALAALLAARRDDTDAVRQHVDRILAQPLERVRFAALDAVLCEPFLALYSETDGELREAVGRIVHTMFPGRPLPSVGLKASIAVPGSAR